jgi:hypothetical protein
VREAKRLRRRSRHQRSLRDVAAELAKLGFVNQRGAEFSASSIFDSRGTSLECCLEIERHGATTNEITKIGCL